MERQIRCHLCGLRTSFPSAGAHARHKLKCDLTSGMGDTPLKGLKWQERGQVGRVAQILEFLRESMCFRTKYNLVSCLPPSLFYPLAVKWCPWFRQSLLYSDPCLQVLNKDSRWRSFQQHLSTQFHFLLLEALFLPLCNFQESLDFKPGGHL